MIEQDFQYFIESLIKAAENMDAHYFQLPIAKKDDPIYRERVYCYELYHQLRCMLGNNFPYKLCGEVDKRGHPIIRDVKPDFIIHKPGDMKYNLAAIEVKPVTVKGRLDRLRKDLNTLKYLLNEAGYYGAIMLIYGNDNGDLPENIKQEIKNIDDSRIVVLWHYEPNKKPKIIKVTSPNIRYAVCFHSPKCSAKPRTSHTPDVK